MRYGRAPARSDSYDMVDEAGSPQRSPYFTDYLDGGSGGDDDGAVALSSPARTIEADTLGGSGRRGAPFRSSTHISDAPYMSP